MASEGGHLTYIPPKETLDSKKVLELPEPVIETEK